jgi:hypothetical protein
VEQGWQTGSSEVRTAKGCLCRERSATERTTQGMARFFAVQAGAVGCKNRDRPKPEATRRLAKTWAAGGFLVPGALAEGTKKTVKAAMRKREEKQKT